MAVESDNSVAYFESTKTSAVHYETANLTSEKER